ncbi:hypothetical protein JAAARDRAFT_129616 [Jaapia argillacea MUCL 33604]|uniref:Prolyl 4-hydroxylase alpha subunit Fe(2+) 2OG dioxygenase domain-containing protein n=1 Tax=Jaapia argillacea MUCL 33604 TaxID=933084 RepID=A0A067Q612_9AGAM|nr:hypothetical protein JAAARDRAFT_129616 [Jaapia argillacea MUCL 33604]
MPPLIYAQVPGNLANSAQHTRAFQQLIQTRAFRWITGHKNTLFSFYAPRLHDHYRVMLNQIHEAYPHCHQIFDNSIWPAVTFNLGPSAVTKLHVDGENYAPGWCAVTSLGQYNPTKGRHFVLFDLKLIVKFLPGPTILIPSSTLLHGNTAIWPHERRYSFTQYAA